MSGLTTGVGAALGTGGGSTRGAGLGGSGSGGGKGRGRALGVGEVKFTGQVTPANKLITYRIDIKRLVNRQLALAFADGTMTVDGQLAYETQGLRVGTFIADGTSS